jgi:hypothetical protein
MCGISPDNFWAHLVLSICVGGVCAFSGIFAFRQTRVPGGISLFGTAIDPDGSLQRLYGCAGVFAAAATLICPFLPHAALPLVHPTVGWICILTALMLAPRLFYGIVMRDVLSPSGQ